MLLDIIRIEFVAVAHRDIGSLASMTNYPRIPSKADQLDARQRERKRQRKRARGKEEREKNLNAQRHECTASIRVDPDPPLRRRAGMREGDRSAVACATRITPLNISFISGPSNYRIPRTCGGTEQRRRRPRSRAYVHALRRAAPRPAARCSCNYARRGRRCGE